MPKLRGLISVAQSILLLMALPATTLAQNSSQQNTDTSTGQKPAATTAVPAADADADSADIPPFARGRISEKEYLELRDQEIRIRRGVNDLVRSPQARSQAVRKMQFQEQVLRFAVQGINPLGSLLPALSPPSWTPLGPDPIPNGQTTGAEVPVSGRVTAIVVSPVTDQTVYVGTAQGGIYRTLDAGATWTPLFDSAQTLAIGALALDPQNPDTLFVGTGEGNLSGDSFFGVGLYIIRSASTATPVITGPFNTDGTNDVFTGRSITKIIVNPTDDTKILVSTASGLSGRNGGAFGTLPARGVYLSTNAQTATPTFTRITVPTGVGIFDRTVTDMVMDPGNSSKILVWVRGAGDPGNGGLWVSTAGDPWANTATWTQTIPRLGFAKFSVNRSGTPAVTTFLLAQDEDATCAGILNQGSLKTSLDGVTWSAGLAGASGFCGGQCFYDMAPAFHPTDANTILLGGSADSGGACASNVLIKSINAGTTFTPVDTNLHADFHALVFAPSNPSVVYAGNDGGVFRSADGGSTWTSINSTGFNATQFVSLSLHPTDPNFSIGGTQDNGTEFMDPAGTWTRADFGDGGYSAIDQNATDTTNVTMYHTYFNQTNNLIAYARATNATNLNETTSWTVFGCPAQPGLTLNGFTCTDSVLFYAPLTLGPGTPNNTLYFGTDHLYRSVDSGTTMTPASQTFGCCEPNNTNNFRVSAIGISPQDDNVRLLGLTSGKVFATTAGANPMTDVTGPWSPEFVARTVVDPNSKTTAYVTLDGYGTTAAPVSHIWKTTNLINEPPTATWTNASNGLPDVPVNAFAIDPFNPSYLYAGTDIGVFSSIDGGVNWSAYGAGLPRVAVFDLNIQKTAHKIRIGTHGRGAWEIPASQFDNTTSLGANLLSPTLGQNVIFTATVNKGTGINVPTGTVTFLEGATVLGTGAVDSSGTATFQTTTLTAGTHNISASYGGDTLYLSSASTVVVIDVTTPGSTPTTTALGSDTSNGVLGNAVTFTATVAHATGATAPTGTVTFDDGVVSIGSTAVDAQGTATLQTSGLGVGSHNVTAIYSGDSTYAASTSTAVAVAVRGPTTLALATSAANPTVGANVTFTATLTTTGSQAAPTGTVTYKDGATTLGQSSFANSDVTTFQTAALALGPHTITAQYAGDGTFVGSTSSVITVTVVPAPPDYQVSIPNGSATITAGQSATYNISITPQGGFNGTISFACSGLPAKSNCSFNPPTLTPSGSATSTTLTIATTGQTTASARTVNVQTMAALTGIGFLGIVFLGVPTRRRRSMRLAGMMLLGLTLAFAIVSCGGHKTTPTIPGTPPGTFSITVTATSGTTTHSSVITLTVH
ncbi:MAG TPA: Ig-like domain repeat protein [Candidatus Angelobacter sp.]|nr:Ig-like domain repeat protein [Candidatus Angelobacter sp.]